MPLPDASTICVQVTATNQDVSISFPGGVTLAPNLPFGSIPSPLDVAKGLLAQVNTALAPLTPVFNLIDLGLAVFGFLKKAATLSVGGMATELVKVAKSADKLLQMVPQLSVPIMILNTVDLLIAFVSGYLDELQAAAELLTSVQASEARALTLGNSQLTAAMSCARDQINARITDLNEGLKPLNRLLAVLNLVASLVPGLPQIPTFDNLNSDISQAITDLQNLLTTLQNVRDKIPL